MFHIVQIEHIQNIPSLYYNILIFKFKPFFQYGQLILFYQTFVVLQIIQLL